VLFLPLRNPALRNKKGRTLPPHPHMIKNQRKDTVYIKKLKM
jgi:hypothetical protein